MKFERFFTIDNVMYRSVDIKLEVPDTLRNLLVSVNEINKQLILLSDSLNPSDRKSVV